LVVSNYNHDMELKQVVTHYSASPVKKYYNCVTDKTTCIKDKSYEIIKDSIKTWEMNMTTYSRFC